MTENESTPEYEFAPLFPGDEPAIEVVEEVQEEAEPTVEEAQPEAEAVVEVEAEAQEEIKPTNPKRKPVKKKVNVEAEVVAPAGPQSPPPATVYAVVGAGKQDEVLLSSCVYKNIKHRKSLSVHHVQRRLKEWGYRKAYSDIDGFYGDFTKQAVSMFQKDQGLTVTGLMNAETMKRLFEGDTNVRVVLS
jgi:hypothetical protein